MPLFPFKAVKRDCYNLEVIFSDPQSYNDVEININTIALPFFLTPKNL